MPALKWGRIDVRDIGGRGLNADVRGPDGPPIFFLQNGFIGPDQRPYPRLVSFQGSTNVTWPTQQLRVGSGGNNGTTGAILASDISDVADVNALTGRTQFAINQLNVARHYQVFSTALGLSSSLPNGVGFMHPANIPAPTTSGFSNRHQVTSLFSNPYCGTLAATPPFIVCSAQANWANPTTTNGRVAKDVGVVNVIAASAQQPGGATCDNVEANCGEFLLYTSAARWYLTKLVANAVTGAVAPNVVNTVDPAPITAFATTEVDRMMVWGMVDSGAAYSSVLGVHATGTEGIYVASQCCDTFQGRIVCGNVVFAPKYTAAGDIDSTKWIQKQNRIIWTILPGEKPTRGPFTTNSEGLTHLQHPWNIEVNNYVDVDGVGFIWSIINMGDNQLFIIGQDGCARLTGYLTTAVSGVNASTFDVRPIMQSPGGQGPGCAVLTANGVFYTNGNTIYKYDGNTITDVLYGAASSLFSGFRILAGQFQGLGGCGRVDDEHVYFAVAGGGASTAPGMLVLNHYTGKWSFHTALSGVFGGSVGTGSWVLKDNTNAYRLTQKPNTVSQPDSGMEEFGLGRTAALGADNSGVAYPYRSTIQPTEQFVLALRPFGTPGIAKRFRHLVINYGLDSPNATLGNQYSLRVRAVYGWAGGWPDSFTSAAIVATLPSTNAVSAGSSMGALPTVTTRIALDDTSLVNFFGDGITTVGWPDTIQLFFEIVYPGSTTGYALQINSIDVSWIERPVPGKIVMGAA